MTTQVSSIENAAAGTSAISKGQRWAGRILSALASLFCLFDGTMKLFKPPVVVQATIQLGYPESAIVGIGVTLLVCTLLYILPRTSVLGAVLLTGYLGGAVASNVRAGMPVFNIVFPFIVAALVWGGLWFRDIRARNLLRE
ncbi:MAG TPA: DoxX family protein [Candidatus Acidoferrum sp.]|nr:DoxX family protein [Candidatus Acidoferrum sp.]